MDDIPKPPKWYTFLLPKKSLEQIYKAEYRAVYCVEREKFLVAKAKEDAIKDAQKPKKGFLQALKEIITGGL